MNTQPSPKVIGAVMLGFALVAGSYVISNFGKPTGNYTADQNLATTQQAAPIRTAIPVVDEDRNGIEDWRDELIEVDPIVTSVDPETQYEQPNTITGQTGINFIQDMIRSRSYGGDDGQVISETITDLTAQTSVEIYDTPDITIIRDWDEASIRTYGNALATAIIENNQSDLDYELYILQDILNRQDESRFDELREMAEIHRITRDAIIDIPVPATLAKEHLDLINTIHALHNDVLAMTYTFDDPAYTLLRIKRYEDDIFGLAAAMENIYTALEPYANLFSTDDPAVFFVQFSPTNRLRI